MRTLSFLMVLLLLAACKNSEDCIQPPCVPPDVNALLNLYVDFCVSDSEPDCYLSNDLTSIQFSIKRISSNELVLDTIINDFDAMDYTIRIGGNGEFEFADDLSLYQLYPENYFEIRLPNSDFFKIDEIKYRDDGPCSCPNYDIESVAVNDLIIPADRNRIIITK